MCGILGEVSLKPLNQLNWENSCKIQKHRGPDNSGEWFHSLDKWKISLGHQRLSILDLSINASQPMSNKDGTSILIFNGEIYNFIELREELTALGKSFETDSDTEVLLSALEEWGIERTLVKLNGMWAFAWLNLNSKKIYLSRDRTGEKPLYVSFKNNTLSFSSELRTLMTLKNTKFMLNFQKIYEFLKFGLVDNENETYLKEIRQVKPGSYDTYDLSKDVLTSDSSTFWECKTQDNKTSNFEDFCSTLREKFLNSVKIRLRSDVPVGILLSGGIDSTSIAGAAKLLGAKDIKLLSYINDDPEFDESYFINIAAEYLNWPLIRVSLPKDPETLFSFLIEATSNMDGPLGSFGNVSHYLLMREAKNNGITVILSGQGADELFCGYKKYLGFYLIQLVIKGSIIKAFNVLISFIKNRSIINQFNISQAKRYIPFLNKDYFFYGSSLEKCFNPKLGASRLDSISERQALDLTNFSIPALNHSEDRMSMAWSREIRLPFLDHEIIDKAIPSSIEYKINQGWTKFCLRNAVEDFIPKEITWRKDKKGFTHPGGEWLKKELKDKVLKEYFNSKAYIFSTNILNREQLLLSYESFCNQTKDAGNIDSGEIFRCVSLEIWLREFKEYLAI